MDDKQCVEERERERERERVGGNTELTHTHTHTHTNTHTLARARARAHTHTLKHARTHAYTLTHSSLAGVCAWAADLALQLNQSEEITVLIDMVHFYIFSNPRCTNATSMLMNKCSNHAQRLTVINNCKEILHNYRHTRCVTRYNCDPMDVFNVRKEKDGTVGYGEHRLVRWKVVCWVGYWFLWVVGAWVG